MIIAHISRTPMASVPWNFVRLINKYTPHKAYLLQDKEFFMGIGNDIMPTPKETENVVKNADVFHYHGIDQYDLRLFRGHDLCEKTRELEARGKCFLEFHGLPQRGNRRYFRPGARIIVSTPEMLETFQEATFFPNLIDEDDEEYRFVPRKPPPPFKTCHHWSFHQHLKDSDVFDELSRAKFTHGTFTKLDKLPLKRCLRARDNFHGVFDHLQGYWGMISLEGLAQGMIVFNGANNFCTGKLCDFLKAPLPPFWRYTRQTIHQIFLDIGHIMFDYGSYVRQGREYIEKYWSGKKIIKKLIELYES